MIDDRKKERHLRSLKENLDNMYFLTKQERADILYFTQISAIENIYNKGEKDMIEDNKFKEFIKYSNEIEKIQKLTIVLLVIQFMWRTKK